MPRLHPRPLAVRWSRLLARGVALLGCASAAFAGTLVVDDDGGPGVDFTDIPPALAAAAPGDLVLVRAGRYSAFTLDKGLTLLGDGPTAVRVDGTCRVTGVEQGARATLGGFDVARLEVSGCSGFLLLHDLWVGSLEAHLAADLRLQRVATRLACVLRTSRVEAVACDFSGAPGVSSGFGGGDGNPGLVCTDKARVHLALCASRGGKGGDGRGESAERYGTGGDGGAGVLAGRGLAAAQLILAGDGQLIEGGENGLGLSCALDGEPGKGLDLADHGGSSAWWSGVRFQGGARLCGGRAGPTWIGTGNTLSSLQPRQATLELLGRPTSGGTVTLRLRAAPGASARLHLGYEPAVEPVQAALVGVLLEASRTVTLGPVPPGGVLDHDLLLPTLPQGLLVLAQASCSLPGHQSQLTNSTPFVIR